MNYRQPSTAKKRRWRKLKNHKMKNYRQPSKPAKKMRGWPYEDVQLATPSPLDGTDNLIQQLETRNERHERIGLFVAKLSFLLVLCALMLGFAWLITQNQEQDRRARERCAREGGVVQVVHNGRSSGFIEPWVCALRDQ